MALNQLTALRISGGRECEFTRTDDRPLQPLDGWRKAPDRKPMGIRSADGTARSVRAIIVYIDPYNMTNTVASAV